MGPSKESAENLSERPTQKYRVCNSDDGSVIACRPTEALIAASFATTEGHVRAVLKEEDGEIMLDLAADHVPTNDTVRVYVEEVLDGPGFISRSKSICGGTPVIAGTRVPVRVIAELEREAAPLVTEIEERLAQINLAPAVGIVLRRQLINMLEAQLIKLEAVAEARASLYPGSHVIVPDDSRKARIKEIFDACPAGGTSGPRVTYARVEFDRGGTATYHLDALIGAPL